MDRRAIIVGNCPSCKHLLLVSTSNPAVDCPRCYIRFPVDGLTGKKPLVEGDDDEKGYDDSQSTRDLLRHALELFASRRSFPGGTASPEPRPKRYRGFDKFSATADSDEEDASAGDLVPVHGLCEFDCKVLGTLATYHKVEKKEAGFKISPYVHAVSGAPSTIDFSKFASRAFFIRPEHLNLLGYGRDRSGAEAYLASTLNLIKLFNDQQSRVAVLNADGDGHCLVHALSRCLTGRELFWHALRVNLSAHLAEFKDRYIALVRSSWRLCCNWTIVAITLIDVSYLISPSISFPTLLLMRTGTQSWQRRRLITSRHPVNNLA